MRGEHFIPISIQKLTRDITKLSNDKQLASIFNIIIALYQYDFNKSFNQIKEHYQLFNPDLDLLIDNTRDREIEQESLIAKTQYILQKANYVQLDIEEIKKSLQTQPHSGLNIVVDIDDYEIFDIYYRGSTTGELTKKSILNYFIKPKTHAIKIYTRLFIVAKLKDFDVRTQELSKKHNISTEKAQKKLRKTYKKLPRNVSNNFIFFKLFKDIPHLDLEMLFFVQKIKLKLFDKLKLLITGGVSTTTGIIATLGKLATALNPIALIGALGGLVGIVVKQVSNLFNQHNKYLNTLTSSLYFQNLDNNLGALNYIGTNASEEEIKEIILGYYFKLQHPSASDEELDGIIERYLLETYNIELDFEIEDSMQKMRDMQLIENNHALPTTQALTRLNAHWDDVFV